MDVRVKLVAQKIRSLHIAEGPRALDRARRRPECGGSAGVLVDRAGPMKIGTRARVGYNLRAAVEPGFRLPTGTRVHRHVVAILELGLQLTVRNQRLSRDQTERNNVAPARCQGSFMASSDRTHCPRSAVEHCQSRRIPVEGLYGSKMSGASGVLGGSSAETHLSRPETS